MSYSSAYSIRLIVIALEGAHQQLAFYRTKLLERQSYGDYLMLLKFSQALNEGLIELAEVLASGDEQP